MDTFTWQREREKEMRSDDEWSVDRSAKKTEALGIWPAFRGRKHLVAPVW